MATLHFTPTQLPLPLEDAVIQIALYNGSGVTTIDALDADLVGLRWRLYVSKAGNEYAYRNASGKYEYLHRVLMARMLDRTLDRRELVDHQNNYGLDNRRSNLRLAGFSGNHYNKRRNKNNTSGYKGVSAQEGRWHACICVNYRTIHLGTYDTKEEAHAAYCEAARFYAGEFARFE